MPPAARHIPRGPALLHLRRLIFLTAQEIRHPGCGFLHVDTLRSCALIAILFRGSSGPRPELNDLYTHLTGHRSLNHALRFGDPVACWVRDWITVGDLRWPAPSAKYPPICIPGATGELF
jgi:hypothetical protein